MNKSIMKPATPALNVVDGIATVSSLDVAQNFGKRHERVLDAARTLIADLPESAQHNFVLSEYRDATGRALPIFRLTRDGFTLLAMGFTGQKALAFKLAYIDAFNRMEAELSKMYMEPLTGDREFRKGLKFGERLKLQEMGQKIAQKLDKSCGPAERYTLFWQLRQVNDTLGIPTPSMEALGLVVPALEARPA